MCDELTLSLKIKLMKGVVKVFFNDLLWSKGL